MGFFYIQKIIFKIRPKKISSRHTSSRNQHYLHAKQWISSKIHYYKTELKKEKEEQRKRSVWGTGGGRYSRVG